MLAKTLADQQYGDVEQLVIAIADGLRQQVGEVDAEIIHVDEANVTGHPEDAAIATTEINRVLEGVQGEKAVRLCYGNYGAQTIQSGGYEKLIAFLNHLHADHVVLEMARRPDHELGIGVIDIKDNEVESPATVAHQIERTVEELGACSTSTRIAASECCSAALRSPKCGISWPAAICLNMPAVSGRPPTNGI